jgi:hypothetical protein
MEYLIGFVLAIASVVVLNLLFIRNNLIRNKSIQVKTSQSYINSLIGDTYLPLFTIDYKDINTQATKHYESTTVRVIFHEDKAYWILNNTFYEADVVDDMVQNDTTKAVDIMGMDRVQLDKMFIIVEKLTKGLSDDSGNPGNKKF